MNMWMHETPPPQGGGDILSEATRSSANWGVGALLFSQVGADRQNSDKYFKRSVERRAVEHLQANSCAGQGGIRDDAEDSDPDPLDGRQTEGQIRRAAAAIWKCLFGSRVQEQRAATVLSQYKD
jgi:hypothetical protein